VRTRYFLAGFLSALLITVAQASYGHRLSGHPVSLQGKLELAKAQVKHDRISISSRHWVLLSPQPALIVIHRMWLRRDRAYLRTLQRMVRPSVGPAWMVRAFFCIHRGEAAWNDSGDPYWGGLQMDRGFMSTYGSREIRRYGGLANVWPPMVQIQVAIRAHRSGRGFYPWPTTARRCGLI
jgi:hypothetical protein